MYPQAYADKSDMSAATPEQKKKMYLFNCAQRAHGNYLENQPAVMAALLISGLYFPLLTTAMGLGWALGRIMYAIGYTSKTAENGKGRMAGAFMWLFQLGLYFSTATVGYKVLMG